MGKQPAWDYFNLILMHGNITIPDQGILSL